MAMLVAVVVAMLGIVMLAGTAYAHTESIHEGMSLKPTPQNRPPVPEVITWSISEESPEPHDRERLVSIIEKSFDMWAKLNPELNFKQVEEDHDILVIFNLDDRSFATVPSPYDYTGVIHLELGRYDCRGEQIEYAANPLVNIMMHEIGHILGLGHTLEEGHLMSGNDKFTQDPFDTLGYNIPTDLPVERTYVGSEPIRVRLDAISKEQTDLRALYEYPYPSDVRETLKLLVERELNLNRALICRNGQFPHGDTSTLDQRVALLYDDVAILDAKLTSIQATLNTINTSIDAILDRLVALETGTSGSTPPTPEPEPEPEPTPSPTPEPEPTMGIIEGKIYNDSNNNDILDAGEPGIPNRTVLLTNYNDWTEILQITTDSNGDYFIELPAGSTWLVQVGGTGIFDYTTVQSGSATVVNLGLIFLSTE